MEFADKQITIAIAGGGLLGRLTAWRLAKSGYQVTVFEQGKFTSPQGACWTAAGMMSPLSEIVHSDTVLYPVGMKSIELWAAWVAELEQAGNQGAIALYRQAGSVVIAHPQDQAELEQFYRDLQYKLQRFYAQHGQAEASAENCVDRLDRAGLIQLEPALDRFNQALYLKSEADLDNRRLLTMLFEQLQQHTVTLVEDCKVQCEPHTIIGNGKKTSFDLVIDTRGLGARDRIAGLRGVRGEVLLVETREIKLSRPVRLMHPRYKLYVVPKPNHQFVIGATEIESEDMSPISLQSSLELGSALYTLHPAFAEARILETSVNCRPATMNNLPVIEAQSGIIRANGLYRHGYLLSPVVVNNILRHVDPQLVSHDQYMQVC